MVKGIVALAAAFGVWALLGIFLPASSQNLLMVHVVGAWWASLTYKGTVAACTFGAALRA